MTDARKSAVAVLTKIEKEKSYSNLALSVYFKSADLSEKDQALACALVYGVLDRRITLDYIIKQNVTNPLDKIAAFTQNVLRTALYQIAFMDKIPPSAAVNEAVKLVKESKEARNAGFVNAVLRSALRTEISLPQSNSVHDLGIRYSCPEWIVESFLHDYGLENTVSLLEESLKPAPVVLRVNTQKTDTAALQADFAKDGITDRPAFVKDSLILSGGLDIASDVRYRKGLYYAQDTACQQAIEKLAPKPGERVLDLCAAPGGKTFTAALLMQNKGEIVACDLHPHRTRLIARSAERMGLDIIKPLAADAGVYHPELGKFDCIICDVPCSGLGVLRRKPDIKYKEDHDFSRLEALQKKILVNSMAYLKTGGRILYSTCTLRRDENENLVFSVQKEYNNLYKMYEHTFMPHKDKTDGFYCAVLELKK